MRASSSRAPIPLASHQSKLHVLLFVVPRVPEVPQGTSTSKSHTQKRHFNFPGIPSIIEQRWAEFASVPRCGAGAALRRSYARELLLRTYRSPPTASRRLRVGGRFILDLRERPTPLLLSPVAASVQRLRLNQPHLLPVLVLSTRAKSVLVHGGDLRGRGQGRGERGKKKRRKMRGTSPGEEGRGS